MTKSNAWFERGIAATLGIAAAFALFGLWAIAYKSWRWAFHGTDLHAPALVIETQPNPQAPLVSSPSCKPTLYNWTPGEPFNAESVVAEPTGRVK